MRPDHSLSGVYAAALTPLKPDSTPDLEAIPAYLAFLAERGCHGALIFGTTGEGPSFSPAERGVVWEVALKVREQYPDFRLLAGTGTPSLQETIDLTRTAFDLGYDGVVVLPPYYFRKASEGGLFNWFDALIRQAVPEGRYLLGYHIPDVSGVPLSLGLLARLKDAYALKFAGIKDSSHDPGMVSDLGEKFGKDLAVFNGTDSYLSMALQNNAAGCITAPANLISPELRKIYDAYLQDRDLSEMQALVTEQRRILEQYMPFPPVLKALVSRQYDFPRWPVRPPLVDMTDELTDQAAKELAACAA